ncbi:MAG TPA: signal peptide peptidase SppA [Bryobacteraceae bacterium]|jgi:protease-4
MGKFFLGFAVGVVALGLLAVLMVVVAIKMGSPKPSVPSNAALVLHLEGDVPEQAPVDVPIPFLEGQQPMAMAEVWRMLQAAAADSKIKSLVIEPRGLTAGWAGLEELRADILAFKKSGKPVHAYLRGAATHDYYVATAADDIYMAPEDELDVKGLRAELVYVKGTLDKLGVAMEFEHVGKYKDAPDQFTKTGPSPETLEVENQILDQYFGDIVRVIAEGRKKSPEAVRALIDEGPFVGKSALDGGLVDGLMFEDEMYDKFGNPAKISSQSYAKAQTGSASGKKIALITEEGDITRGGTNEDVTDSGITVAGSVKTMREVENDSSIQGVILRINSPGGDGIASDDILHEAKKLSQKKPMVISMGDLAASGGYFIAMTGDPVVSYANTLTGSIGVFYGRVNLKGLYDKIGLSKTLLTRGKYAAIDSENGPLTDEQRAKLRKEIEGFYSGFVQRVADGRKRKYDEVEPLAQGRVWLGSQAKGNGLVDEIGGLDRAVELVKQRAKIGAAEKVTLVTYPPKRSLLELILNRGGGDSSEVESKIRSIFGKLPVRALAQGGVMRLMPFTIEVK